MRKVKITVVKRLSRKDIHGDEDPGCSAELTDLCPAFTEGQEFVISSESAGEPEGFCSGAWADIFRHTRVLLWGGHYPWMNEDGKRWKKCFAFLTRRLRNSGSQWQDTTLKR